MKRGKYSYGEQLALRFEAMSPLTSLERLRQISKMKGSTAEFWAGKRYREKLRAYK